MGSILMPSFAFRASLSEDSGVRAGLTLTQTEMLQHLGIDHPLHAKLEEEGVLRIRSEEYNEAVGDLLFALGAADSPGMPTLGTRFTTLLGKDWRCLFTLDEMLTLEGIANHYLNLRNTGDDSQNAIFAELKAITYSKPGVMEVLIEAMSLHFAFSPSFTRDVPNADLVALNSLFASEQLPTEADRYFDQRFINYLNAQPDKIKDIHWRQFEGLAAEWFQRSGYTVELGPGRNDGSIDVRMWASDAPPGSPPTVIVQCKRQERKVDRVIVKALYADMMHERAVSGLVVTTSDITPGAAKDISARAYPITTANRERVREWVSAMRKPGAGIVADATIDPSQS